jgi:Fe-S-cluster containining protein
MQGAIRGERDADVPCGGCTACCASSQFVHIGPDETETLSAIPRDLLFPAPRMPGHMLLGYDERGRCPMLDDDGCSIYDHRPRTCRTYDCRVFPATGVEPDDKPLIAERARRWQFDFPTEADHNDYDAAQAAAISVRAHADLIDSLPPTATQIAVLAIENARDT